MSVQSVHASRRRRKFLLKLAILALALCSAVWIVKQKKDMLVREGAGFLQRLLSRETQLDVRIGKISGKLSGHIRFQDVRLEDPALPASLRLMFHADDVEVRFDPLDFLTKKFDSKLRLEVRGAKLYLLPMIRLRRDRFHFVSWARDWALTQRRRLDIKVRDLKVYYGSERNDFSDLQFDFKDDVFGLVLPLRHVDLMGADVTTQVNVRGTFESGPLSAPDAVTGSFSTGGTVVNWSPLPWETQFDFLLTREQLVLHSIDFLGGIEVSGGIDFLRDNEIEVVVETRQYAFRGLGALLQAPKDSLEGSMDLSARLAGDWRAPRLEADVRIMGGRVGRNPFKAMVLHMSGIYPTMHLSESHVLLEDGSAMRFADETVEFADLFSGDLYRRLVHEADQDTVVVGDWEFKRPENERTEFRMQRRLGEHAGMYIRRFNGPSEEQLDSPDDHETQFGFEYRLKGKDTLKFEANEDENFFGVERKLSF